MADCIEHVTVVEDFTLSTLQKVLLDPGAANHGADTQGKEQLILDRIPGRANRVKGIAAAMPSGRWPDFDDLLYGAERRN